MCQTSVKPKVPSSINDDSSVSAQDSSHIYIDNGFSVDDFSDAAFDDPILLLKEFERLSFYHENVQSNMIRSGDSALEVNVADESQYDAFLSEVREMRMSYSYKPILIKAIMQFAERNGCVSLPTIIDYYLMYFQNRAEKGLIIEKPDSTFVQHFNDRKVARRTILIYPYKRFELKGMMKYDKAKDEIEIVPPIWDNISNRVRRVITAYCDMQLEKYYARLDSSLPAGETPTES